MKQSLQQIISRIVRRQVQLENNLKTPAEIRFRRKPDLSHLRIFDSECYNYIPANNRSKFQAKSTKCIFLGYTASTSSYRLWDIEQNKLVIGKHVTFNEALVLG